MAARLYRMNVARLGASITNPSQLGRKAGEDTERLLAIWAQRKGIIGLEVARIHQSRRDARGVRGAKKAGRGLKAAGRGLAKGAKAVDRGAGKPPSRWRSTPARSAEACAAQAQRSSAAGRSSSSGRPRTTPLAIFFRRSPILAVSTDRRIATVRAACSKRMYLDAGEAALSCQADWRISPVLVREAPVPNVAADRRHIGCEATAGMRGLCRSSRG
ncbi:MAG: hypothetical protein QOF69_1452 [Solirubrobacteraceae bacterium]|jgi:hypothetical protein|nr:hypothetical protein [Solirubrobacteraceae bacterium]